MPRPRQVQPAILIAPLLLFLCLFSTPASAEPVPVDTIRQLTDANRRPAVELFREVAVGLSHAHSKGVLIIAASGNEGVELEDFGPGGYDHVLTVGATHTDDRVGGFSNFGAIGIQLGGIGPLAPTRKSDLAQLGLRAMVGGMLAACMTASRSTSPWLRGPLGAECNKPISHLCLLSSGPRSESM